MIDFRSEVATGTDENNRSFVLQACRSMLRPIIRLLLKSGIVHRDFINLSREIYVDIARNEFGLRDRPTSISRTALLTGLARKEVRRIVNLMEDDGDLSASPSSQDRITRVLSGWYQDENYLTRDGQPLDIAVEGPAPSFADLKSRYGGDVPASAILRELLNAGTVVRTKTGLLHPTRRNFAPNPTDPEYLLRAGSVIEDIGATVNRNLYRRGDDPRSFERRAVNTFMPESRLPDFRSFIASEGQHFLEEVDAWLTANEDTEGSGTSIRLGLGMYLIMDDHDDK